jgi:hypothetical protein
VVKTVAKPPAKSTQLAPASPKVSTRNEAKPKPITKVAGKPLPLVKAKTVEKPAAGKSAVAKGFSARPPLRPAAKPSATKQPGKAAAPAIGSKMVARQPAKLNGNGNRKSAANSKTAKHVATGKVPKGLLAAAARSKKSATKR